MAAYNNMHLLPRSFHGLEGLAEFNWASSSGFHNPAVKVLAKAGVLFDSWGCSSKLMLLLAEFFSLHP